MRYFVPVLAAPGARGWSGVVRLGCPLLGQLCLGAALSSCGGLAEDGPRLSSATFDPDPDSVRTAEQLARRSAEPRSQPEQERQQEPQPERAPADTGAGQACSAPQGEGEGVVVGTVELRSDPLCGASGWCLLRAPPADECRGSARSDTAACTTEPSIPVAPPRSTAPEWQEDTCTCRCDGQASDVDYCTCPQGMRCEPLIPSAGLHAAARSFIGSYCVY